MCICVSCVHHTRAEYQKNMSAVQTNLDQKLSKLEKSEVRTAQEDNTPNGGQRTTLQDLITHRANT